MRNVHVFMVLAMVLGALPLAGAGPLTPLAVLVNETPDEAERDALAAVHPLPGQGTLRPGVHGHGDRTYALFVDFDGDGRLDEGEEFATSRYLANPKVVERDGGVLLFDDPDDDDAQDASEPGVSVGSADDADGDGWSNGEEMLGGGAPGPEALGYALLGWLDPARTPVDPDGDGYGTREERCYGTSPHDPASRPADTDGDGVNDAPCSDYPDTYPGDEDDDDDGLTDEEEAACGTDPKSRDTDGDGVGDADDECPSGAGG